MFGTLQTVVVVMGKELPYKINGLSYIHVSELAHLTDINKHEEFKA